MYRALWGNRSAGARANHSALTLVTPPAIEPVNLVQVKRQARIVYPDSDPLLAMYIPAARDRIERYLRRALITQQWDLTLDWGPAWIEMPLPPLQRVDAVYTRGLDNVEQLVDPSVYFVDAPNRLLSLVVGGVWPVHRSRAGIRIRYTCGYGPTADDVPVAIRKEILALVAQFDDIREQVDLPSTTTALLRPYRIEGLPYRTGGAHQTGDTLWA